MRSSICFDAGWLLTDYSVVGASRSFLYTKHSSTLHDVWIETCSHICCSSMSTSSYPRMRNHHLVTRPLSLVLNFLQSWSFPATGQSWAMVVDTVCVVQAFMVPQTLRTPGTLTFSCWGWPGEVPEFGCRWHEWRLSLWVSSLIGSLWLARPPQ